MTGAPEHGPANRPPGPYDTEADTRSVTLPLWAAWDADPGAGKMAPQLRQFLGQTLEAASVEMGRYDDRIADWLAIWEPATVAVVAGWVIRARRAELQEARAAVLSGVAALTPEQLRTVLFALYEASEARRDAAENCAECGAGSHDVCGTCQNRLSIADDMQAVAESLRSQQ
jgi:hypothetical protein